MSLKRRLTSLLDKSGPEPTTVEDAIHAEVVRAVHDKRLREGDVFKVKKIRGHIGPHHSPWHITYSAEIEKDGAG